MVNSNTLSAVDSGASDLVRRSLAGSTAAFAEIVAAYQALVCSVTYNGTGSISRSEDLAQEVFVTAWQELRQLREPAKLRAWLCGIARRVTANARRREGREPACAAEELGVDHFSTTPNPSEQTISREEEAILWRSLEQMPEIYREPLILFYRQGESVQTVANTLELSDETARQRLSRGRKMLQEHVALFVEGALRQSAPGRAFTMGVVAALPLMATSASAATIGWGAAKGSAVAQGATFAGILGILVGPLVGCLGAWMGVKASLDSAESERERQCIRRQARVITTLALGFALAVIVATFCAVRSWESFPVASIVVIAGLPIVYVMALVALILHFGRQQKRIRSEDSSGSPEAAARHAAAWKTFEYKSKWAFLGLPLVHVRSGRPRGEKLRPAVGWIAIGDVAIGVLCSVGGLAFGGLSIGGLSLGFAAVGGASVGIFSFGGAAFGWWSMGGLAIGYLAHGGFALAWHAAEGGLAAARHFAQGGAAYAVHANDAAAMEAIKSMPFFARAGAISRNPWWLSVVWLPTLLVVWQAQRARKALQGEPSRGSVSSGT